MGTDWHCDCEHVSLCRQQVRCNDFRGQKFPAPAPWWTGTSTALRINGTGKDEANNAMVLYCDWPAGSMCPGMWILQMIRSVTPWPVAPRTVCAAVFFVAVVKVLPFWLKFFTFTANAWKSKSVVPRWIFQTQMDIVWWSSHIRCSLKLETLLTIDDKLSQTIHNSST